MDYDREFTGSQLPVNKQLHQRENTKIKGKYTPNIVQILAYLYFI